MPQSVNEKVYHKRFTEKKSFRTIATEIGSITFQRAQQIVAEYLKKHPELKPAPATPKAPKTTLKVGGKGHARNKNMKIGEVADILIDGRSAKPVEKYAKCSKPNCEICKGGPGHGPYIYLHYRDGKYESPTPIYLGRKDKVDISKLKGKSFKSKEELKAFVQGK